MREKFHKILMDVYRDAIAAAKTRHDADCIGWLAHDDPRIDSTDYEELYKLIEFRHYPEGQAARWEWNSI